MHKPDPVYISDHHPAEEDNFKQVCCLRQQMFSRDVGVPREFSMLANDKFGLF